MENKILTLADIPNGEECIITKVHGTGHFRNRIIELGFIKGTKVKTIKNAPLQDPIEYELMNTNISLRISEAKLIEVAKIQTEDQNEDYHGIFTEEKVKKILDKKSKIIDVALVGNPNCGKTSLFNRLTGLKEKVGNYSGVTVDVKHAKIKHQGYTINITDLPGTYSLREYTAEEEFVPKFIIEKHPDIIINVVDSTSLERNMYLTTQLIDMHVVGIVALNMYDELENEHSKIDTIQLEKLLGMSAIPTIASKGVGVSQILDNIVYTFESLALNTKHIHINYGKALEESIQNIRNTIESNCDIAHTISARYLALRLLEKDTNTYQLLEPLMATEKLKEVCDNEIQKLEKQYRDDTKTIIADAKYAFIHGALRETFTQGKNKQKVSNNIDEILTNKWLALPLLTIFMWLTFEVTFSLGNYPMEWIESGVTMLGKYIASIMDNGPLKDLLIDGIMGGVGGVLVFLPNILILFFFISLMEDSGYMARTVFIMDKLMHKVGLHGKSFIPMIIGLGCSVPAVLATRTLENKRDRLITMLITPFISCSARLPVYILFVSAFFAKNQSLALMSIYLIGILIAILTAWIFKNTIFKKSSEPFVMELPPYRIPTLRNTVIQMWTKASQYLKKMGTVILVASIILWALGYFPQDKTGTMTSTEQIEQSYIGHLGKAIEPIMKPLGFDWRMGVSILTGVAAKEVVVSTMGVLYNVEDAENDSLSLVHKLQQHTDTSSDNVLTPLTAYGFMIFILLYFPCIAVIAAIKNEAGWKWAIFSIAYSTSTAWLVSFIIYQIGRLF